MPVTPGASRAPISPPTDSPEKLLAREGYWPIEVACRRAGMSLSTFARRCKKLGLSPHKDRGRAYYTRDHVRAVVADDGREYRESKP